MSGENQIAALAMAGLEEPCSCCCRSYGSGEEPYQQHECSCNEDWKGKPCQVREKPEHFEKPYTNIRGVSSGTPIHLSKFCHECDGTGKKLTDAGEKLLDFMQRRMKVAS